jgi:hypothetical protein
MNGEVDRFSSAVSSGNSVLGLLDTSDSDFLDEWIMPQDMVAPKPVVAENVIAAVYAHVQAVRALGKTVVTPEEISRALGLSTKQVEAALNGLKERGVKPVKR